MKKYLISFTFLALSAIAMAQSGTNSPFSMYGLGKISDQSAGFNRGMNGVGIGFREHNQVNYLNPASYSAIDSLTFILDAGMSLQTSNFRENGKSFNAKNADFEYAVATFRAMKHMGVSFGLIPFTNVGYSFYSDNKKVEGYDNVTSTQTYSGSGGLRQIYLGVGYQFFPGFSAGFNASYLWGNIAEYLSNSYSDSNIKSTIIGYYTEAHSYRLDFGLQYSHNITKKDVATIGVTYTPGHAINKVGDPKAETTHPMDNTGYLIIMANDTSYYYSNTANRIPTMVGVGLSWTHDKKLKVGMDYTLQRWSNIFAGDYSNGSDTRSDNFNTYLDRHKFNIGGEYCPNEFSRDIVKKIRYRFGVGYATPFYKVNNNNGPRELSMSAGVGIPIINNYNTRSILNVGVQWTNTTGKNLMSENTLMLNIGLTFNERWFAKWKFE